MQRLPGGEPAYLLDDQAFHARPERGRAARDVRGEEHAGGLPQRVTGGERLVMLTDADQLRAHAPALRECAEEVTARMSP